MSMSEAVSCSDITHLSVDQQEIVGHPPLSPAPGVDVWHCHVSNTPADIRILSYNELERAQKFRNVQDRLSFESGRSWIRSVLAPYLDMLPEEIVFQKGPFGKPYIDAVHSLFFNWSHTEGTWVLAVSRDGPIGVDVELVSRRTDRQAVAAVALHKNEQDYISRQPDSDRSFLNIWVRREALFKAVGFGLHDTMQQISTVSSSGCNLQSVTGPDGRLWSVCDVALGEGMQCSLAYEVRSPAQHSMRKH